MTDTPDKGVRVVDRARDERRSACLNALLFSLFLMGFFYVFASFAHGATISGSVYSDEGVTKYTTARLIRLLVNGTSAGTATTVSGDYSITATINAGDAILVYTDDNVTTDGTTVTVASGADITLFNIYQGYVITRHDNSGALTNANMSTAKGYPAGPYIADADITYTVASGNLTVSAGTLYLLSGHSFSPGGNVTTPAMKSLGTFSGGSATIDINGALTTSGTFTSTSGTMNVGGNFTVSGGTFNAGSGTITLDTTTATKTVSIGSTLLNNVTVNLGASTADLTITGTMTVGGNLTLTQVDEVSGEIAVAGNVSSTNVPVSSTGTLTLNGAGNAQTISGGGRLPSNLTVSKFPVGTVTPQYALILGGTLTVTSGTFNTNTYGHTLGGLTVDGGTLNAGSSTTLDVNGAFSLSLGTFTSPTTTLNIGGNFTVSGGTFTAGTSTIVLDTTTTTKTVNIGSTLLNNVTVSLGASTADLTITGTMTVGGNLTLTQVDEVSGEIAVAGNVSSTNVPVSSTGTLTLNGAGNAQTISGGGRLPSNLTVNKFPVGTVTPQYALILGGTLTATSGTFNTNAYGHTLGALTIDGGTLNAGSSTTLDVNGAFSLSLGTFTSPTTTLNIGGNFTVSGGTFTHNNGTIVFDPTAAVTLSTDAAVLNNVSISTAMTANITISGTMTVAGYFTVNMTSSGDLVSGTVDVGGNLTITLASAISTAINVAGNVTSSDAAVGGVGTITLDGGGAQTITAGFDYPDGGFIIYKSSGTASPTGAGTFSAGALAVNLGTFNSDAYAVDINGAFSMSAGSFTSTSAQMNVSGSVTISGGTFNHNNGTIVFDPTAAVTLSTDAAVLNNVSVSTAMTANITISGTMTVAGYFTVNMTSSGDLVSGTVDVGGNLTITLASAISTAINVAGNVTSSDAAVGGTGTITLDGGGAQTITAGFDYPDGGFIIYKSSGTASPTGAGTFSAGALAVNLGTFNSDAYAVDVNGAFSMSAGSFTSTSAQMNVSGSVTISGGTFNHNNGTIVFDPTAAVTLSTDAAVLNNVSVSTAMAADITISGTMAVAGYFTVNMTGSGADLLSGTVDVGGNLTITAVVSISTAIYVEGNVTSSDAAVGGTGTITLDGGGAQTITGGDFPNGTFTINKAGGSTASLASNLTLNSAGQDLTVTAGTLDLAGYNLTLTVTGDILTVEASGTLRLRGSEIVTATTRTYSGTVYYYGDAAYATGLSAGSGPYTNLTFNSTAGTGAWTLAAALTVNGNLTITSGTLDVSTTNYNVTIGGNLSNTGTFNTRSNTVTFNGTDQTISGNNTFFNLTKTYTTGGARTLTFEAVKTQTINGTVNLAGYSGYRMNLRSSVTGTRWNFTLGASAVKTLNYLDVKDSDASGSAASLKPIDPLNSVSSGNNISWFSPSPTAVTSASAVVDTANQITASVLFSGDTNTDGSTKFEYSLSGSGPWTLAPGCGAVGGLPPTRQCVITGLTGNTNYYINVTFTDPDGVSGTNPLVIGPYLTYPGAPGTPTFSNVLEASLTVNWTAPAGGAATYNVERSPDGSAWAEIASGIAGTSYPDSVVCNTTYFYRVRGLNATGYGNYSTSASQTTLSGSCALTVVSNSATVDGPRQITVTATFTGDSDSDSSTKFEYKKSSDSWTTPTLWRYKRTIYLSPATPSAGYQVKVELDTSNFYYSGAKSDGGDIRFYDTSDNELNYWIETWNTSGASTIWVKVPTAGTSTINMYYGYPGATPQSNGGATFEFFDDFTGTTIDTAKWAETDSASNYITQNNSITISNGTGAWGGTALFSQNSFARGDKELWFKFKPECTVGATYRATTMIGWKDIGAGVSYTDMPHAMYFRRTTTAGSEQVPIYEDGTNRGDTGAFTCGTQYWGKVALKATGADYYLSTDGINWTLRYTGTYSSETPLKVGLTHLQGGSNDVDNVFIRSYSSTEPSASVGGEGPATGAVPSPAPACPSVTGPSPRTCVITGLEHNTSYDFRITHTDPDGVIPDANLDVDNEEFIIGPYTTTVDTTPPANVTGFTVTDPTTGNRLNLSWTNPAVFDFAGVKIMRVQGPTPPANCSTGQEVYRGMGTSYSDFSDFGLPRAIWHMNEGSGTLVSDSSLSGSNGFYISFPNPGFETVNSGWGNGAQNLTFDSTRGKTGAYSGKIVKSTSGELTQFSSGNSDNNAGHTLPSSSTQYKYGGCVYIETTGTATTSADIFFFSWNSTGGTRYDGTYNYLQTSTKNQWVCLSGTTTNVVSGDNLFAIRVDNNGVVSGSGTATVWFDDIWMMPTDTTGKLSNALKFDGVDDYVSLGNPSSLQITGDQTIAMWVKPTDFSVRRNPYDKAFGGEGAITIETDGSVSYYYGTAGGMASPYQYFGTTSFLSAGVWTHLVLVRDLTNMKLRWYMNGVLTDEEDALYPSATASSLTAYIGNGYTNPFNGSLDEVAVWNRALSATEVSRLHNSGNGIELTALTDNTQYSYRICAFDTENNYSTGVTGTGTPTDTTPPSNVTGLTATPGDGMVVLSWTNPSDIDLAGVRIVRSTSGAPPLDCSGTALYSGTTKPYTDTDVSIGTYYYRVCAYDEVPNYSLPGATASASVTVDTAPPPDVTNFTAIAGNGMVALSWTNPPGSGLAGVKILQKTGGYPSSCTDGAVIYDSGGTNHTDTGLINGTTYYYRACAHDAVPYYSTGVTASATPAGSLPNPAVTDLRADRVYTRGINLAWTAPAYAAAYDMRFTDARDYPSDITSIYMNVNWASLDQATGEQTPQAEGSTESLLAGGLIPNTLYYFALETTGTSSNTSTSNVASTHTALKYGYNIVGLPYNTSTGGTYTVSNIFGDDVASVRMYRWQPAGLDAGGYFYGSWVEISPSSLVTSFSNGAGYYFYAYAMNASVLDEKNSSGATLVTGNTNNWVRINLSLGRNLISNPYSKNVDFVNIKICKNSTFSSATGCSGGTVVSFKDAVTNGWLDGGILYQANSTTYNQETCNALSCTAKLRPWWGQWVYLLLGSDTYIMAVPKP